ncbi:DUF1329 domain-containing protein [Permianibacter sp. IMCC34836]|nr:DUF1329 domain-containing protein [Permianibacter fluminis]
MNKKTLVLSALLVAFAGSAAAKVSPDQADRLGKDLTPTGAERAGNRDGTIPAWEGGITKPPAGFVKGKHMVDPFPNDKVLFTITSKNADQYKDQLSPGVQALLKTYPDTFKMNVYPTRRSAASPQYVYDAIKRNATTGELLASGNGFKGAAIGVPFPIPANGTEAIWNHITRFRGVTVTRDTGQAAVMPNGAYTLVKFRDELDQAYMRPNMTPEELERDNLLFFFKQWVTSPSRLAGTALLVHETLDQVAKPRQAWTYNTGQQRVRRAPNVAYDAPGTAADNLRTTDDFDMFNGSPDRYNWKLIGKKEMYIPYNSYKLDSNQLKYDQILKAGHINQDYVRWELHRVWVVEATLKDGMRHAYKKRVMFLDEDSWQVSVADMYDDRDVLWRVSVAHAINYYELPVQWSTLEVIHDLQSRRYLAVGLDNEDEPYDFDAKRTASDFTPDALRRQGRR